MRLDLGDVVLDLVATVKGIRPPRLCWHIGAPIDTVAAERIPGPPPSTIPARKDATIVQLQADKKIPVTAVVSATDEVGNPVNVDPGDVSVTYAVDDPSVIALTDNGDGSATAAATGILGTAQLTATVTHTPTGRTGTDVLTIEVVPGDAEVISVALASGAPEEVTPDA